MTIPFWDPSAPEDPNEWLYADNDWDRLMLGPWQIPGIVNCEAISKLAANKAKPSGKHGARITSTGKDPQEAEIKIYLCNRRQWNKWQEIKPRIYSSDRSEFIALDARAPAFDDATVKSVVVLSATSPTPGRVPLERLVTLKVHEYSPPNKDGTKTPRGSKGPGIRQEFDGPNFSRPDGTTGVAPPPANARQAPPSQSSKAAGP